MQCWLPPRMHLLTLLGPLMVIKLMRSESSIFFCSKIHYEPHLITKQTERSGLVFSMYLMDLNKMLCRPLTNMDISDFLFFFHFSRCRIICWIVKEYFPFLSVPPGPFYQWWNWGTKKDLFQAFCRKVALEWNLKCQMSHLSTKSFSLLKNENTHWLSQLLP